MKTFFVLSAWTAIIASGFAQAPVPTDSVSAGDRVPVVDLTVARQTMAVAKVLARNGNVSAVEQKLATLATTKSETAEWHFELAQRLVQIAEHLARAGEQTHVDALIRRALANLALGEAKAPDDETRASAKTLIGFLQERYLADAESARASYDAAVQLAPEQARQAKLARDRLKLADDRVKQRQAAK